MKNAPVHYRCTADLSDVDPLITVENGDYRTAVLNFLNDLSDGDLPEKIEIVRHNTGIITAEYEFDGDPQTIEFVPTKY